MEGLSYCLADQLKDSNAQSTQTLAQTRFTLQIKLLFQFGASKVQEFPTMHCRN